MQSLQSPTSLVDKVLAMIVAQVLRPDHPVQVGLEQFLHDVNLLEFVERFGLADVQDGDQL